MTPNLMQQIRELYSEALRRERHQTHAETMYWLGQYKLMVKDILDNPDWVCVPREPTGDMILAGIHENLSDPGSQVFGRIYKAMLAASPPRTPIMSNLDRDLAEVHSEFEAWYAKTVADPRAVMYNNPLGLPADGDMKGAMWSGWQAAIRTHHAEIARDREKLKALEQAIRESKAQWFKTQSGVTNWIESRATEIMQENQNAKTL